MPRGIHRSWEALHQEYDELIPTGKTFIMAGEEYAVRRLAVRPTARLKTPIVELTLASGEFSQEPRYLHLATALNTEEGSRVPIRNLPAGRVS